ncbi:hypothetical protein IKT64_00905 [Candidatus Saccharibacteria bacterium]|nr:hypothetical protein [Candidatus Saccharibacteria bacterium]
MKNKLTKVIAVVLALVFAGGLIATPAFAEDKICTSKAEMGDAAWEAAGCDGGKSIEDVAIDIIKVIIGMLGIVAVIFIVVGGISYMTSSGDAGKVKKAKDTILYAVIGLVVCALAFAIVNFAASIINGDKKAENNSGGTGSNSAMLQIESQIS